MALFSTPIINATFVHLDIFSSQANCSADKECLRTVSSRLGRDFMYLYSTNKTPAGPAYIASGTPPVYVSWIFHLYTSGCRALWIDRIKLCSFIKLKSPLRSTVGQADTIGRPLSPLTDQVSCTVRTALQLPCSPLPEPNRQTRLRNS